MTVRLARAVTPLALASTLALVLAGCGGNTSGEAGSSGETGSGSGGTVAVEANNGTVEVPAHPQRVVALDSTSFQTLQEMGITPVAAPKQLLPGSMNEWKSNEDIIDVGTHREPRLEAVNQAQPDLIVGGKRFEDHTQTLSTIAPVIDLAADTDKPDYVNQLKTQTTSLGEIFGKQDVADQLNADLDEAVRKAADGTTGQTVFLANHNGGKIDNGAGRLSSIIEPLNMTDVFAKESQDANSDSIHQDSGLAPETVAQADPDWMIVMDRDAATATGATTARAAQATVAAQTAWNNTTFVQQDQIVYLPADFYVTEGIHAYTDAYTAIADALTGAN